MMASNFRNIVSIGDVIEMDLQVKAERIKATAEEKVHKQIGSSKENGKREKSQC